MPLYSNGTTTEKGKDVRVKVSYVELLPLRFKI